MIKSSHLVQGQRPVTASQETEFLDNIEHISVVGDSVESLAIASLFVNQTVHVCPVTEAENGFLYGIHSFEIRQRFANVCFYRGGLSSDVFEKDLPRALKNSRAIFICSDASRYSAIAKSLNIHLKNGQLVCLVNAPLGGALQFQHELNKLDCLQQVSILEVGRIFDSILIESGVMLISGLRKRIPVCGITKNDTRKGLKLIQKLVDETVPSSNLIERGLVDVERILRPVLALSQILGWSENSSNGININGYTMKIVKAVESELQQLSKVYGSKPPEFLKAINDYMNVGDIASDTLFESVHDALNSLEKVFIGESDQWIENSIDVLIEDIEEFYCLLSELGTHCHLPLPTIDSIINLSSCFSEKDLRVSGRTLESLGLLGYDSQEIVDLVNN